MPAIKRRLIADIGAEQAVDALLKGNITNPTDIADRINQEPHFLSLIKGKGWAGCMARDVDLYLRDRGGATIEGDVNSDAKALQESSRAQALVRSVQERVNGLIHKAEAAEYILDMTLRDVEKMQRDWRDKGGILYDKNDEMVVDNRGNPVIYEYPAKEMTAMCRLIDSQLKWVQAIKGDDKVQQLVRAQNVNVSQGITQEELFQTVFGVCELLGHNRGETLDAYSKYMSKPEPIDAEVVNNSE